MEAEIEQVRGPVEVQCPQCGQQFAVDPEPVRIPVVKAQAVTHVPVRQASHSPQSVASPHAHRKVPPAASKTVYDNRDPEKWKLIGLIGAGLVLVAGVVWFLNFDPAKQNQPTAEQKEAARLEQERKDREEAEAAERERVNAELQKMKDKLASEAKIKEQAEEERRVQERLREEEKVEIQQVRQERILDYYAENGFGGDRTAAEAFVKVTKVSAMEVSDLLNDGDSSNDPKTREEADRYFADRVLWHLQRDDVLKQWIKDHDRDARKLVAELLRRTPSGGNEDAAPSFDFSKYASMGSGFWISSDGWMLTNEHVVSDARNVDIRLQDGTLIEARVVKADEVNDLALVKADFAPKSWLAVSKGEVDLSLGRTVFTVGYPTPTVQGVEPKFTDGRISAASGIGDRKDSYQITIPVQGGNSGGAMVDFASGWVVGVINAKLITSDGVGADNVSYAIKSKVACRFMDSVPEAKDAVIKSPLPPLPKGDERAVIERATKSAVLILRKKG